MPYAPYAEVRLLDSLFGCVVAQVNQTISANTAAQTSITLRGSSGAGNADITPANNEYWLFATPGSGATQNQYTNVDVFLATGGTTTSITFASRTVVAARAVGDVAFRLGTTTTFLNWMFNNTVYVGLSTVGAQTTIAAASDLAALPQGTLNVATTTPAVGAFPASGTLLVDSSNGLQTVTYTGTTGTTFTGCAGGTGTIDTGSVVLLFPTSATILSNEPSATGSYARVAVTNNVANFAAATGSAPASKSNVLQLSFPASTGSGWSSGATALDLVFVADASTLGGGNVLLWGYATNAQTVNAAGVTPSIAAAALVATML